MLPVLWLCGPPGAGKTAVGWQIYSDLTATGVAAGYVDIDQLGMCYPERASDPGRHRLQAGNLGPVVARYAAAGARCVVVSGVVDPDHGVHVGALPPIALTVCRLRAGGADLEQRLLRRGADADVAEVRRAAEAMDASDFADAWVDTTGLSVAEVARQVRSRTGGWPVLTGPSGSADLPALASVSVLDGSVLWLCGAHGVGKSTIGFATYLETLNSGRTAAYLDLDQIAFCNKAAPQDPRRHRMKADILAALWQNFRTAGAERLVMVGPVQDRTAVEIYRAALPAVTITVCRLHAGRDRLAERIMLRRHGGSWAQPGDPLSGQPIARLRDVAGQAAADAIRLERAAVGDLRIDTDERTVGETVAAVVSQTGWLPRPG